MRVNSKTGDQERIFGTNPQGGRLVLAATLLFLFCQNSLGHAQSGPGLTTAPNTTEQRLEYLTVIGVQAPAQMECQSEAIDRTAHELTALKRTVAAEKTISPHVTQLAAETISGAEPASAIHATLEEIQQREAVEEFEIATHDVTKVETESKYPLKASGLLLPFGDECVGDRTCDAVPRPR